MFPMDWTTIAETDICDDCRAVLAVKLRQTELVLLDSLFDTRSGIQAGVSKMDTRNQKNAAAIYDWSYKEEGSAIIIQGYGLPTNEDL